MASLVATRCCVISATACVASRRSTTNRYRDYYVWRDSDPGDTSAEVVFPGEEEGIWTLDERTGEVPERLGDRLQLGREVRVGEELHDVLGRSAHGFTPAAASTMASAAAPGTTFADAVVAASSARAMTASLPWLPRM